jgi:hypothetical protein
LAHALQYTPHASQLPLLELKKVPAGHWMHALQLESELNPKAQGIGAEEPAGQ